MNRFSREKHYSLINCIIYFLLIFSCDRCVHSEEIGAYSFSYQDQYVYSALIHTLINNKKIIPADIISNACMSISVGTCVKTFALCYKASINAGIFIT